MGTLSITAAQLSQAQAVLNANPNNPAATWSVLANAGDQYAQAAFTGLTNSTSLYGNVIQYSNANVGNTTAQIGQIAINNLQGYLQLIQSSPNNNGSYQLPNTEQIETNYANAVNAAGGNYLAPIDLSLEVISTATNGVIPNWYQYSYGFGLNLDPSRRSAESFAAQNISLPNALLQVTETSIETAFSLIGSFFTGTSLNAGEGSVLAAASTLKAIADNFAPTGGGDLIDQTLKNNPNQTVLLNLQYAALSTSGSNAGLQVVTLDNAVVNGIEKYVVDVGQDASLNLQAGSQAIVLANYATVQAGVGSAVDIGVGYQDANVSGSNVAASFESDSSGIVSGSQNIVADSGNGPLQQGRSVAIDGNANTFNGGVGDTVTLDSTYSAVNNVTSGTITLVSSAIGNSLNNDSGNIIAEESGASANLTGSNNTVTETANGNDYIGLTGSNNTVTGDSGNNLVYLEGSGTSATVDGGGTVGMYGSYQNLTLGNSGSYVGIGTGQIGEAVSGSSATIGENNGATGNFFGSNDTINMNGNTGSYAGISGTNHVVNGDSGTNLVNLTGVGSSATVYGTGAVGMTASNETLTLGTAGSDTGLSSGITGAIVNAANDVVYVASNDGVTVNGKNTVDLTGSNATATVTSSGALIEESPNMSGDIVNAQANGETITASDTVINVAAGDVAYISGADDRINLVANSGSYIVLNGLYNTVNSSGNAISLQGAGSQMTEIGSNTVYMTASGESLNGNGAGGLIDIGNGGVYYIHDDHTEIHEGSNDALDLDGSYNYVESNANSGTYTYGGIGNTFSGTNEYNQGYTPEQSSFPGNEQSSFTNDPTQASFAPYDTSLSSGDENNGGDPGNTGYVDDGGYTYSGPEPDGVYYAPDPGDYSGDDFASNASAVSAAGINTASISALDLSKGDPVAAAQAQASGVQAALATQSTGLAGAATTAVMSGAFWQVAVASDGSRTVTWSFASSAADADDPFSSYIGDEYKATIEKALQAWSNATGVTFAEVADPSSSDIRIGFGDFDTASTGILGFTHATGVGTALQGAVIRLEDPAETAFGVGSGGDATYTGTDATLYQVALHEIGRAIGFADNADPASVMYASSSASNRDLDTTDLVGGQLLYGIGSSSLAPDQTSGGSVPTGSPAGASAAPLAASTADPSGFNQMIQAIATFSPQVSSTVLPIAAQNNALATQLAAPLQH